MKEIYKDIPGYGGKYQVSNLGNVKNVKRLLAQQKKNSGYMKIGLSKDGIVKTLHSHRLVASAFLGLEIESKLVVCHINDTKDDNRVENLFIGTLKDNSQDCVNKGRSSKGLNHQIKNRGERSKKATISNEKALIIKEMLLNGEKHRIIAESLGVSIHVVKKISSGKSWKWL